jgi:hypothetical protein
MAEEDVAKTLAEYTRVCVSVAKMLHDCPHLTDLERLTLENNIAIVQLNFAYWVRQFAMRKFHHAV